MSELTPSVLVLDKGLNLQAAKIIAPPGSVLDTLNYEQVDFQGQKRIDGFARYDGSKLPALDEYHVITLTDAFGGADGNLLGTADGLLGIAVGSAANVVNVAVINENLLPEVGDELFVIVDGVNTLGNVVTAVATGTETAATADIHYDNLLAFTQVLRDRVEGLPGSIIGLHWFRDRLYAVADVAAISLQGTTPTIYPGDELVAFGETVQVLDSYVSDNTRVVFISTLDAELWATLGEDVERDSIVIGTTAGFEELASASEIASFFESRSEAQVLEEDGPSGPYNFGWRFVHHGWLVEFGDGVSLFGSLPSLNQNITGIGTQGPTSITGNNGAPATLTQKVNITTRPSQANGWKTSDTPTSYNLDPLAIRSTDTDYIYADAYVSWDGTSGAVSAPGLTSGSVPEYPANNTVVITL